MNARYTKTDVDGHLANAVASGKAAADAALASAKEYSDGKLSAATDTLSKSIEGVAGDVAELGTKIDTIIGEDSGLTTRDIVVDELAKQLLSDKADADFKTLKELADWLENHPEDVASINSDIKALSAATGSLSTSIEIVAGDVAELSGATIDGLNARYTKTDVDGHLANAVASGKAAADAALASAKEYSDGILSAATDTLSKSIEVVAGDVAELSGATIDGLNARYTKTDVDGHLANAVASGKAAADAALADAKEYSDGKLSAATSTLSKSIETVAGDVADLSGATIDGLNARYTKTDVDTHLANAVASGQAAANAALASAKEYSDGKLSAATDTLSKSIEAVAGDVTKLSGATVELAGKAVTSIKIEGTEDSEQKQTVTVTIKDNEATFNFLGMVIDGGTF